MAAAVVMVVAGKDGSDEEQSGEEGKAEEKVLHFDPPMGLPALRCKPYATRRCYDPPTIGPLSICLLHRTSELHSWCAGEGIVAPSHLLRRLDLTFYA